MKKFAEFFKILGKTLMVPISVISIAGIFLGLAAALQNPSITGQGFQELAIVQNILGFIRSIAGSLFGNLPVLFAVAVAFGTAQEEKPTAAFSAVIGFIVMHQAISYALNSAGMTAASTSVDALRAAFLEQGMDSTQAEIMARMENAQYASVLGIFSYNMNIFGGIIAGFVTGALHNKYWDIVLPESINFYGGRRFVPIITICVLPFIGLILFYIWPFFGNIIFVVGDIIGNSGVFGTFLFGFMECILIPTGLHHILNQVVRFTPVGGMVDIDGVTVVGALNIFNTALANNFQNIDLDTVQQATRFLAQGKIPIRLFALPAAAYAMYKNSFLENRDQVKSLFLAAATTSFVTGICEPVEFLFLFVYPPLYVFHAIFTGISFMSGDILHAMIGNVQGGIIDLLVFGVLGGMQTKWYLVLLVGVVIGIIYYFVFDFCIKKMNLQTPGREQATDEQNSTSNSTATDSELADLILKAVGGKDNVKTIDNCFTRLRLSLVDIKLIDEALIKSTGANGFVKLDNDVQIIYGPKVEKIANDFKVAVKK